MLSNSYCECSSFLIYYNVTEKANYARTHTLLKTLQKERDATRPNLHE